MLNFKLNSIALGLVLIPALSVMANAQSLVNGLKVEEPSATQSVPSDESATAISIAPNSTQPQLGTGAASAYCTYYTYGSRILTCYWSKINANSRVFAAISEYSTTPQTRFIGSAKYVVNNVRPFNGGVQVWVDIHWGSSLRSRLDLLVDP